MILLDGKKIAEEIYLELKAGFAILKNKPRLAVILVGKNPASEKFIEQKKKAAEKVGVSFRLYSLPESIATNELRKRLAGVVHESKNTGVVIQLPLPGQINAQYILNSIIPEKDVDVLSARALGDFASGKSRILPPVVGAVQEILARYNIDIGSKNIVLVGAGHLVGKPLALWLANKKTSFSVVERDTPNSEDYIKNADILISGIGRPGFIKGDWLKKDAVVIDAGTSEDGGRLVGDVDFESVSKKASYITPVPGGVGPITVAIIFKNLLSLATAK